MSTTGTGASGRAAPCPHEVAIDHDVAHHHNAARLHPLDGAARSRVRAAAAGSWPGLPAAQAKRGLEAALERFTVRPASWAALT
jgi:hypothetical protein